MATLAEVLRQAGYVTPQGQVTGPRTDLAQKLKSYVMNIPQNAAQNLANQRADIDAALTMGDKGIQIGDRAAFARQMAEVPNLMGLTAYHGTPHTIKGKFDISKVGTGEGAQAYGHGMYFAESPAVAQTYANLGTGNVAYRGHTEDVINKLQKSGLDKNTADLISTYAYEGGFKGGTANDLANFLKSYADTPDQIKTYAEYAKKPEILEAINSYVSPKVGNLYKVDIPDEYIPNMLDWDKPLSQQPKAVQDALAKYDPDLYSPKGIDYDSSELGQIIYQRLVNDESKKARELARSGQYIEDTSGYGFQNASKRLNEINVKGIRYLDEGSRNAVQRWIARHPKGGESDFPTLEQAQAFINKYPNDKYTLIEPKPLTSNFVVFEPSEVKILEQNSKPLTRKEIIEQELEKIAK